MLRNMAVMTAKMDSESSDEKKNKPKNVTSRDVQIPEMVDNLCDELSAARFLSYGTSMDHWVAMIPEVVEPLRTNYHLDEFGIIHNQNRAIHVAHEKSSSLLQLKHFRDANLSKVEEKKSFTIKKDGFTQQSEEAEVSQLNDAMSALLNYMCIRLRFAHYTIRFHNLYNFLLRICPGDHEVITLYKAVKDIWHDNVLRPNGLDIATLFVQWQAKRASNGVGTGQFLVLNQV